MYKELEIKTVEGEAQLTPFKAIGTTAYRFKQLTKKDLMVCITNMLAAIGDLNSENDSDNTKTMIAIASSGELESISQLAYVMYRQATAKSINDMADMNIENYLDWLDQYDSMEFLWNAVAIIKIYMNNTETSSEPKKEDAQLKEE